MMIRAIDRVEELFENHPDLASFLLQRGIVCFQCGEPYWGTPGKLVKSKRQDVDPLLAEIDARFGKGVQRLPSTLFPYKRHGDRSRDPSPEDSDMLLYGPHGSAHCHGLTLL